MYNSPIKIYETAMQTIMEERENAIFAKVQSAFGVDVDKDELIRALQYDRGQYEKGYADGKADAVQQWIPASEPPKDDLPVLVTCGKGYRPFVARYDLVWNRWKVSHTLKITHWQPLPSTRDLPQPPKEG